jgi:hypothetical protein
VDCVVFPSFPTRQAGEAEFHLRNGKEVKRRCFGKLRPDPQWCQYPNSNVVPEIGARIIGVGESLPFKKVSLSAPGPKHTSKK